MIAIPRLLITAARAGVRYIMPNWFGHNPASDKLCEASKCKTNHDKINQQIETLCSLWYEFSLYGGPERFGFDSQKCSLIWFDDGDVFLDTSTWPQCGRAVASLLCLGELPGDGSEMSLILYSSARHLRLMLNELDVSTRFRVAESLKNVLSTQ